MSNEPVTEAELKARATAPRITPEALEANIADERYFSGYEGVLGERFAREAGESDADEGKIPVQLKLLTFCVLTLQNGFTVVGTSACASPENYDRDIGQRVARGDAVRQIWGFMGYELRTQLKILEGASEAEGRSEATDLPPYYGVEEVR